MGDTPAVEEGESCCPALSSKARYIGFIVCLAVGIIISLGQFTSIFNFNKEFALWLTVGDCLILGSTLFLTNFKTQMKKMLSPLRAVTSIVLLASIACTIIFSLMEFAPGMIIAAVVQYCAMFWYVLSLIPGAQACFKTCVTSCGKGCCECCAKGMTA